MASNSTSADTLDPAHAIAESPAVEIERDRRQSALRELADSESYSRVLFHATQTGLVIADLRTECIMEANPAAAEILGTTTDDLCGHSAAICGFGDIFEPMRGGNRLLERHKAELRRSEGTGIPVILSAVALKLGERDVVVLSFVDIGDISAVQEQLRQSHVHLEDAARRLESQRDAIIQSEKMASIGQLAAGVAHEINNPIGYITSNLATISEYTDFLRTLLMLYRQLAEMPMDDPRRDAVIDELTIALDEEDLEFVLGDLDVVLRESVEGTTRVADIVQNLKSFAREDSLQKTPHDLNEGVEAMIRMVWNELKYSCKIEKDLGELPLVRCHAGQINQVIMNVLVNAAHAMAPAGGTITIRTHAHEDAVEISISDTGCGMTPEVMQHIFDPFFTTKDVGKGTGLGLSISHGIVSDHGGHFDVSSEPDNGSNFRIFLPLAELDDDIVS
jgi:PAS domain S-box-containing protein